MTLLAFTKKTLFYIQGEATDTQRRVLPLFEVATQHRLI